MIIKDQFSTFFDAEQLVDDFESVLKKNGIIIASGSKLERLCLNISDLVEKHIKPHLRDANHDNRPFIRECLGLIDLITKIVKSSKHANFQTLLPYLEKLNENNPIQNTRTSVLDQDNNKLFELYIATLCLNLNGSSIAIDDPDHSVGDNPDIIVEINGKSWGFGCKTLHSKQPMTIFENIEKAVDQIEKSIADVGVPIINVKNIIDHDFFWPELTKDGSSIKEFGAFTNINFPLTKIQNFCSQIQKDIIGHVRQDNVHSVFVGKKSSPAALLYFSTVTSISMGGQPYPTRLNTFNIIAFGDVDSYCLEVCEKLNHELQIIES